jgi:hypothetical protein
MLYFSRRSQVSRPDESVADRIRIWYSPTVNLASIFTPRSSSTGDICLTAPADSIIGAGMASYG